MVWRDLNENARRLAMFFERASNKRLLGISGSQFLFYLGEGFDYTATKEAESARAVSISFF